MIDPLEHKSSTDVHQDENIDTHQQQILFDDLENNKHQVDESIAKALVFDNHTWQALDEKDEFESNEEELKYRHKPRWLWRAIASLSAILIITELVVFFTSGFINDPVITSIYALLLACFTLIFGSALMRELSGLKQLKRQNDIQEKSHAILSEQPSSNTKNAEALCQQITQQLPSDLLSEQEQIFTKTVLLDYSDAELLQFYSQSVLTKVDKKVMTEIAKFSSESVVLVALSPIALLDMLIMFSRNLRLINKVSSLYGLKLGYWSRIKLIKQVFVNMAYAGASELIADVGAEILGADLLSKLSSRFAQGLGAGMLTARLGINAMTLCRPIPLYDNKPRLKQVSREVVKQIKQLIKKA